MPHFNPSVPSSKALTGTPGIGDSRHLDKGHDESGSTTKPAMNGKEAIESDKRVKMVSPIGALKISRLADRLPGIRT